MSPAQTSPNYLTTRPTEAELATFPEEDAFNSYLDRLLILLYSPVGNGLARSQHRR